MRFGVRSLAVSLVTALTLVTFASGVANAQQAIGPNQHFLGFVNGSSVDPVVYTVCPGPASPGRTGPVAGGQTMSVGEVAAGHGFTGPFSQIYSWFVPVPTTSTVTMLKFTTYGTPQSIPTSIRVPCHGTGKVEFSSCPFNAPCAFGWVPTFVHVRFVDIAV